MNAVEAAARIEYTFLKHDSSRVAFDAFLEKCRAYPFGCIIVPPAWVPRAVAFLGRNGAGAPVGSVAAFPLGYALTPTKSREIEDLLGAGAVHVDLVQNIALLRGEYPAWKEEVWSCAELVKSYRGTFKLILEANLLSDFELERAAVGAVEAGVHYLKTGTGYFGDARVEHVKKLREVAGGRAGVKAAGGIRTPSGFQAMLEAGADRVGSSAGFEIVRALEG